MNNDKNDWLTDEDLEDGTMKFRFEDVHEMLGEFYPSPDHLYGYFVQKIGNEKARYFTPQNINLLAFEKPEKVPFLDEVFDYVVEIEMTHANSEGGINAVSIDNLASAFEEIASDVDERKNIIVSLRNVAIPKKYQYPYFIVGTGWSEENSLYEVSGEVDSSFVDQYTHPSEERFLEIYIKRTQLGDMREAEYYFQQGEESDEDEPA